MAEFFPINPNKASWDTSVTQEWEVEEARAVSGRRRTLVQQSYPSWTFSLKFPHLNKQQVDDLLGFYAKMRGKWGSFFYKDCENHHIENGELLKQGDKYYCRTNLTTMYEPCHYVENLRVFVDGKETTRFTEENGVITLDTYGIIDFDENGVVTATYDYYYLVSFGKDLKMSQIFNDLYSVNIELSVVRE